MAESKHNCDVTQGFKLVPDAQVIVGHLTALTIADKKIKADLAVGNPEDIKGDKIKVVGVISKFGWEGGSTDPMDISCRVSVTNKQDIALLTHNELSDTTVTYQFIVYEFDPVKKQYFQCIHCGSTDLNGLVAKSGAKLALQVDTKKSIEVPSPENYALRLRIMPEETSQEVHLAIAVAAKWAKKWGIQVG
ncbi:MAG: hypothetical protein GY710_08615 [Desulfobacteraceae bacterium]|nr:hypothetical protein [Desulfobacteraceae bacterium]